MTNIFKCAICKKKLSLIPIQCRCLNYYCSLHICSSKHNCNYDYKKSYKKELENNNKIIKKNKIIII